MYTWIDWMIMVGCTVLGYVLGLWERRSRLRKGAPVGLLVVDEQQGKDMALVYLQTKVDPKTFKDGEIVQLEVAKIR